MTVLQLVHILLTDRCRRGQKQLPLHFRQQAVIQLIPISPLLMCRAVFCRTNTSHGNDLIVSTTVCQQLQDSVQGLLCLVTQKLLDFKSIFSRCYYENPFALGCKTDQYLQVCKMRLTKMYINMNK